jgi:hypothetical protein
MPPSRVESVPSKIWMLHDVAVLVRAGVDLKPPAMTIMSSKAWPTSSLSIAPMSESVAASTATRLDPPVTSTTASSCDTAMSQTKGPTGASPTAPAKRVDVDPSGVS